VKAGKSLLFNIFYHYYFTGAVTIDDIKRVSTRMLGTNPSVAAFGNLSVLPKYEIFQQAFANKGVFPGKSLFFSFRRV
jgi:hypothetical protein